MTITNIPSIFQNIAHLATWTQTQTGMAQSILQNNKLPHLIQSAKSKTIGPEALQTFKELKKIIEGTANLPACHRQSMDDMNNLLNLKTYSTSQTVKDTTCPEQSQDKSLVIPMIGDPRAVYLPRLQVNETNFCYINGYDPKKNTFSQIFPTTNDKGKLCLMVRVQNAKTFEVIKVRELGYEIFHDEKKGIIYFATSKLNDSPVFALELNPKNPIDSKLARYPNYAAAGFTPPLIKSTVFGYQNHGNKNDHFFADIYISPKEKIEITIIENNQGEIDKVTDFRLGKEYIPQKISYGGKPTYRINNEMTIGLTRCLGEKGYYYRVEIFHNLHKKHSITHTNKALTPISLNDHNSIWMVGVDMHVNRLKRKIESYFHPKALLKELHKIKNEEGLTIAHEVIMALYFDGDTQMQIVDALKHSRGLPLPADTRIIPTSADTLTSLTSYLKQHSTSGKISKTILKGAQKQHSIPARYIHGLWLSVSHNTIAETKYLRRGAATPEYVKGGFPVQAYRRIIDENYTGIANTLESRASQRERVLDMLNLDSISASFKHYLGHQLDLAEKFDLLILDSGYLFYNDKRIHPLEESKDQQALEAIDNDGDVFLIPRVRPNNSEFTRPLVLTEQDLSTKRAMFDNHPNDQFRFIWLTHKAHRHAGSYRAGTILIQDEITKDYRRPAAPDISNSMKGLLSVPPDYLEPRHILSSIDEGPESIQTLDDFEYEKGDPVEFDLQEYNHTFLGTENTKIKMIPYYIIAGNQFVEINIPSPDSTTANVLRGLGYFVPTEEDLPKIVQYYLTVVRKGFQPETTNLYLLPGMMDDGILGLYRFSNENILISSRKTNDIDKWAAKLFYRTIRHELGHAFQRINPWISSLMYRCMALDGVSMDYGNKNINEYWAVLVQNFFDHPQNRTRFPNGYRLIYTLIKMRESGVTWDGPHHEVFMAENEDMVDLDFDERNIDGTYGALRDLATGKDPFETILNGMIEQEEMEADTVEIEAIDTFSEQL